MKSSIFVLIVMFLLSGCSDFLDVTPKDKQTSEQLYRTKMVSTRWRTGFTMDCLLWNFMGSR